MEEKDIVHSEEKKKRHFGGYFQDQIAGLSNGGKPLVFTVILTFFALAVACIAVFFASVQGAERVMMPNVTGKTLTTALLELQAKELYPKIQLRYSEFPGEEGKILEQSPSAGSIVKAYRQVTLTVSRGVAIDRIEEYVGKQVDDVQSRLQLLFTDENPLVTIASPIYQKSEATSGTILAQYPSAGTIISEPITLRFVVSSPAEEMVTVPALQGLSIAELYKQMEESKLVFDFVYHETSDESSAGRISAVDKAGATVVSYSRVTADIAFPIRQESDEQVYGIFSFELDEYPFPVPVRLECNAPDGKITTLVSLNHPGKSISIPYYAQPESILSLYVLDRLTAQVTIQ